MDLDVLCEQAETTLRITSNGDETKTRGLQDPTWPKPRLLDNLTAVAVKYNEMVVVNQMKNHPGQGRAERFTQLNLTSANHQMRIKKRDKWKTAFQTWYGHFKYQVMPFRFSNALASFQGYINKILAEKLDIFVIVYLDNILIYTEDPGQGHVKALRWVFDILRRP